MLFRRFYDDQLAQASYLIGCQRSGEAVVVDPNRDAWMYLAAAEAEGVTIAAVTETHIHADFVSGARELSALTGARMFLSNAGPVDWKYGFSDEGRATPLDHGDRIELGSVILQAVHTPGHTPEHLCFLVTDGAAATEPMGVLTGDFVFVGDVGRPDLLEKAAKMEGVSDQAARDLFQSLRWFLTLPEHLQVWPGHGAGSACGKGIGAVPQSTVGYEKRTNWALDIRDEAAFVGQVLFGQPEPPRYFGVMKRINRDGPRILGGFPSPPLLAADELPQLLAAGATVVDIRPVAAFAAGHVPGTINVPFNTGFTTYGGSVLPYDRPIHLLSDGVPLTIARAVRNLVLIGLDQVPGWFDGSAIARWEQQHSLATIPQLTPAAAVERVKAGAVLIDVRGESEWRGGHLPGARLLPLPELVERAAQIPRDRPVVLHCQGGSRSAIAASLLRANGWSDVANLTGGYSVWLAEGRPVEKGRGDEGTGGR